MSRFYLWDLPTRLFHWLLVGAVSGALISVKLGEMVWHGRFGLLVIGLIVFRICWGLWGSSYARFSQFVAGPSTILAYLRGRWQGVGHNPLGALSVIAILLLLAFQASSGLFISDDIAFDGPLKRLVSNATSGALASWHMRMEWVIYGLIGLHLGAIFVHSVLRGERLVGPMITGIGQAPGMLARDASGGRWLGLAVALAIAAAAVWLANGALLPPPPPPPPDLGW
jgi:cytochrome b